jgi:hypothetical protein
LTVQAQGDAATNQFACRAMICSTVSRSLPGPQILAHIAL